jgi:hypothetical protein
MVFACRRPVGLGGALAAAWLAVVGVLALTRELAGTPATGTLAASPRALAHGQVWRLFTSGLLVQGPVLLQLAGTAVLAGVLIQRFGGALFWLVAAAGHLGGALLVYAGVGLVWLVDRHAVREVAAAPDYGISAAWAACVGAIFVAGLRGLLPRARLAAGAGIGCLLAFLVLLPTSGELAGFEHLAAFLLGAAVMARVAS